MITNDPRITHLRLNGEMVLVPAIEAWREIIRDGELNGEPIESPEFAVRWLNQCARFDAAILGVRKLKPWPQKWLLLSLLKLGPHYLRVHFEEVICEHCGRCCGTSATPSSNDYAGTGLSHEEIWAEFKQHPVQKCPHCANLLQRRQTLWLAVNEPAKDL